jgi:hypothetical protein
VAVLDPAAIGSDELEQAPPVPERAPCLTCGETVLYAAGGNAASVRLDPCEISPVREELVPGEPLVAFDAMGIARFVRYPERDTGEAWHRAHRCVERRAPRAPHGQGQAN